MNTIKYILLILLFPVTALSQSVSVSPISFEAWGKTPYMSEVSIEYEGFSAHYFNAYKDFNAMYKGYPTGNIQSSFAVSYNLLNPYKYFYVSPLISLREIPFENGSHINFRVGISYPLGNFRINYTHTSSGFGLINKMNPGLDFIGITYSVL